MIKLWCSACHTVWTESCFREWQTCPFKDCDGTLKTTPPAGAVATSRKKEPPTYPLFEVAEK